MSSQSGFLTAPGGFGVATRTPSLALGTGLQAGTGLEWCELAACRRSRAGLVVPSLYCFPRGLGLGLGVSRHNTRGRRRRAARARLGLAISDDLSLAVEPMA
jgi:hypothetical protein